MVKQKQQRRFTVHLRGASGRHARVVEAASLEQAAVSFLEHAPIGTPDDEHVLSVIVREVDVGHEHCFKVDLDTGKTSSCG